MQNDVLTNKIAPWLEKGRWYHGIFDYAAGNLDRDKTDSYIIDNFTHGPSGTTRYLVPKRKEIRILNAIFDAYGESSTNTAINLSFRYQTDGVKGVSIGPYGLTTGIIEFWLFIVEK